jgi:hypothetical protein
MKLKLVCSPFHNLLVYKFYHFAVWAKADGGIIFLYKSAEICFIRLFILLSF